MRCRCGTTFPDDEHRCPHCGRRVQTVVLSDPVSTSVAPEHDPAGVSAPVAQAAPAGPPRQASLFGGPKVIPIEALAGGRRRYARRRDAQRTAETHDRPLATQQALELRAPKAAPRPAVDYGEAEIASPAARVLAAILDQVFCGVGIVLVAVTFHFMGGRFVPVVRLAPWYGAVVASVVASYYLFFALLGRDTAGMACCRLRVVTFDGLRPEWTMRIARLMAGAFGTLALGLGLLWALVDDESLTWHDHITKTFPTKR